VTYKSAPDHLEILSFIDFILKMISSKLFSKPFNNGYKSSFAHSTPSHKFRNISQRSQKRPTQVLEEEIQQDQSSSLPSTARRIQIIIPKTKLEEMKEQIKKESTKKKTEDLSMSKNQRVRTSLKEKTEYDNYFIFMF
jgi:hypothetical protein